MQTIYSELSDNARSTYDDDNASDIYLYELEAEVTANGGVTDNQVDNSSNSLAEEHEEGEIDEDLVGEEAYRATKARMNNVFRGMEDQCSYCGSHQPQFHAPHSGIPCPDYTFPDYTFPDYTFPDYTFPDYSQYYPNPFAGVIIPGDTMPCYGQENLYAPQPRLHYNYVHPIQQYAPQHYVDPYMFTPQPVFTSDMGSDEEDYESYSDEEGFLDEGCIGFHYDEEDYNVPYSPHQYEKASPSPSVSVHQNEQEIFEALEAIIHGHKHAAAYDQVPVLNVYS